MANIGRGFGSREPLASQNLERDLGVLARHVGIAVAVGRRVTEVPPAIDHLLGRAAADPQLKPATRDQISRPGVLGEVQRVLVAHVDHGGTDLDPRRPRADRREQRERRAELSREMVNAEVRAVGAQFLRRDRELDRLQQRIRARARPRVRASAPMTEGQESDLLQAFSTSRAGERTAGPRYGRLARGAATPALDEYLQRIRTGDLLSLSGFWGWLNPVDGGQPTSSTQVTARPPSASRAGGGAGLD